MESNFYYTKLKSFSIFGESAACYGLDLTKKDTGLLAFIATNNWTTNAGATILREKIRTNAQIIKMIDFGDYNIFDNAGIQTMIMIFANSESNNQYEFDYRKLAKRKATLSDAIGLLALDKEIEADYLVPVFVRGEVQTLFNFSNNQINAILQKLKEQGLFLSGNEVANGIHPHYDFVNKQLALKHNLRINEGIFGLTTSEHDSLRLSELEMLLIKPYYTTEQIHRYYSDPTNTLWLIYTGSQFKNPTAMKPYPNLKKHLDRFADVITSDNKPYGLHRAREESFFLGEKIIVQRKCAGKPSFSYSNFDSYVSATFYVIKTNRVNQKYLVGLLNSRLIEFWLKHKGKMQGSNFQLDKEPLLEIPIVNPDKIKQQPIINLVDRILAAKSANPTADTSDLEREIDRLVYALYTLTADEIRIIEERGA